MNVFILCTGRTGSVSFIKACENLTNFTASHESKSDLNGEQRFDFPDQHIEADNRLIWDLGRLDQYYGKDAFYVHLTRDHNKIAQSFEKRVYYPNSMIKAYCDGIKKKPTEKLTKDEIKEYSYDLVKNIEASIALFLKDKPLQIRMDIDQINTDFPDFWSAIQGEGKLGLALEALTEKHNQSKKKSFFWYHLKINALKTLKSIS
ncbi:MAG: hypothetical protein L0J45_00145 [Psychroflexus sp.]|nr:hypothetical protein [Psychroflexus sp.]MDN6309298.1 hypothetical protein [Psychroflexus sp.]